MPKVYFCLKCSTAEYKHSRWCRNQTTKIFHYNSKYKSCEADDPDMKEEYTQIFKAHDLVDLKRMHYCSWDRDYMRLRRVYTREYKPANWKAVGWYCDRCGNFIKSYTKKEMIRK